MPTYVYKREDGTTFEVMQRITDEALAVCPTTGQTVKRVIGGGAGLIFKGNGFYLTDYARKKSSPASTSTDEAPSAESSTNGAATKKETPSSESSESSESSSKKTDSTS